MGVLWRWSSDLVNHDIQFVTHNCSRKGHLLDASYHQKRRLLCHATLQAMSALLLGECFDTVTASPAVSAASSASSASSSLSASAGFASSSVAGSVSSHVLPSLDQSPIKNAVYPWLRDIVRSSDAQVSGIFVWMRVSLVCVGGWVGGWVGVLFDKNGFAGSSKRVCVCVCGS